MVILEDENSTDNDDDQSVQLLETNNNIDEEAPKIENIIEIASKNLNVRRNEMYYTVFYHLLGQNSCIPFSNKNDAALIEECILFVQTSKSYSRHCTFILPTLMITTPRETEPNRGGSTKGKTV